MAFDIEEREQELAVEDEGKTFAVLDANGEPDPDATWTVCGMNSEQYAKAEAWQQKAWRALRGREMTAKEQREHKAEFIARCSKGFTGMVRHGQPIAFSVPAATKILLAIPYLRRQVEGEIGDRAGFTTASTD